MKLTMLTMIDGNRSDRSASMMSGNGVVYASSSATWTLSQLLSTMVRTSRSPSRVTVTANGPRSNVTRGSPGRVK